MVMAMMIGCTNKSTNQKHEKVLQSTIVHLEKSSAPTFVIEMKYKSSSSSSSLICVIFLFESITQRIRIVDS